MNDTDLGRMCFQMVMSTREATSTGKDTEKELIHGRVCEILMKKKDISTRENSNLIYATEMVSLSIPTAQNLMALHFINKGSFSNGKRHGQGVYLYPNGDIYQGEWIEDLKSGFGIFIN